MTRRKLCVVCRERPAQEIGALDLCSWCDAACPGPVDAIEVAAHRARNYERRRWIKVIEAVRGAFQPNAPRNHVLDAVLIEAKRRAGR